MSVDLLPSLAWWALGGGGLLAVAIATIVLIGGWPLLLNRRVLIGLAIAAAVIGGVVWIERAKEALIERGRAEELARQAEVNARAHRKRQEEIASYVVGASAREVAALEQLRLSKQRIDLDRIDRERNSHVTPAADARCDVSHGFVLDHDAALSGAAGRTAVSVGQAADVNRSSGIALSLASREIGRNYAELGKCLAELKTVEDRRYTECVEYDRKYGIQSGCTRGGAQEAPRNPKTEGR